MPLKLELRGLRDDCNESTRLSLHRSPTDSWCFFVSQGSRRNKFAFCCRPPGPLARREQRCVPGPVREERATKPAGRRRQFLRVPDSQQTETTVRNFPPTLAPECEINSARAFSLHRSTMVKTDVFVAASVFRVSRQDGRGPASSDPTLQHDPPFAARRARPRCSGQRLQFRRQPENRIAEQVAPTICDRFPRGRQTASVR
jgi:hypothetical protein